MARTKQTARKTTGGMAPRKAASVKKAANAKKEVLPAALPSVEKLKLLALIAATPKKDIRVSADAIRHIKEIFVQTFSGFAVLPLELLEKLNKKADKPSSTLKVDLLQGSVTDEPIDKAHLKAISCKAKCRVGLVIPRRAFKKYLTVGSNDGRIKAIYTADRAPKITNKKGETLQRFRFTVEFLIGLQEIIEDEVILRIREAWEQLDQGEKTLTHEAFVKANLAWGGEPALKKKKAPAKKAEGGNKAKKSPAKKAKVAAPKKRGRPKKQ